MISPRQRELAALLNRYAAAYYEQDAPLVSDAEYDALYDELLSAGDDAFCADNVIPLRRTVKRLF